MAATATEPGMRFDAAAREAVSELCRRFQVRLLDVFGSAARPDFDPARSDVDLLVSFEPGAEPGMFGYIEFIERLEALFGRHVDLLSDTPLRNPFLRQAVEAERRPLFAQP